MITSKSDIWSLGMTLYDIIHHGLPFNGDKKQYTKQVLTQPIICDDRKCSSDMKNLLNLMLEKNPKIRPSASTILSHPIIKQREKQFK